MQVAELLDSVKIILGDVQEDRWTTAELLAYVNAGMRDIATRTTKLGIPAYQQVYDSKLQEGAYQDAQGATSLQVLALISVDGLMGTDWIANTEYPEGTYVYSANVRYVATTDVCDAVEPALSPNWRVTTKTLGCPKPKQIQAENLTTIAPQWESAPADARGQSTYWGIDSRQNTTFFVYPPQPADPESTQTARQYARLTMACVPADIQATEMIPLEQSYLDALQLYVLARAFAKGLSNTGDSTPATLYAQMYNQSPVFFAP